MNLHTNLSFFKFEKGLTTKAYQKYCLKQSILLSNFLETNANKYYS